MRLEAQLKAIMIYNMDDVSNVLPSGTVKLLETKINILLLTQALVTLARDLLHTDSSNSNFTTD